MSKQMEVEYTSEGAVVISYETLTSNPQTLQSAISTAFGSHPSCLGIIIVTNLPAQFVDLRERLLKLAGKFAMLPESVREKYADASSKYSFGWSHGKEIMNGKPDLLKGSYYANPIVDHPGSSEDYKNNFPEYYGQNIWPNAGEKGIGGFEEAFKSLGKFIYKVGVELAAACQPFVASHLLDQALTLPGLISPNTAKARLLHYFPPLLSGAVVDSDDEPVDSWCGFHLDHSLLTGLCSAMYLSHVSSVEPEVCPPPSSTSGLYIRTRGGDLCKVSIPADCLAFQTGEALEVVTNGRLRATPHCVRVGSLGTTQISRETFALFMGPDVDTEISEHETFGSFSKRIINGHYDTRVSAAG